MTTYAHIENGMITGRYDTLPKNWRNISNFYTLETETDYLHSLGWRMIVKDTSPFNETTHRLGEATYAIVNDEVIETIPQYSLVVQETDNSILHNIAMTELRQERDRLLKESDFSQLSDVVTLNGTEITQAYIVYRQQLRELPDLYENDLFFTNASTALYPTLQLPDNISAEPDPTPDPAPE